MFTLIDINELVRFIGKKEIQLIDIRDAAEYSAGHLPGAKNIVEFFTYLSESSNEGLLAMQDTFSGILSEKGIVNDLPVVVYEEEMDKKYGGSCRAAYLLTLFGHKKVYVLHGGYSAWVQRGMPVSTDAPKVFRTDYRIAPDKSFYADYRDMLKAIARQNVYILDNRDKDEWTGRSSSPYGIDYSPRKGRIPGARWIEWYNLMETADGIPMFKSDAQIRNIAESHGIHMDSEVIVYCFKGSRASNTLLALYKAGYRKIRVYFASWYEWAKHPELPIDDTVLKD
ncbi:MAG: sulfurtransferase [Spirochaetales bacterium]|nr:sulfurtransferase [Spirochaetales bacterium]